jgi:hypothetical protein
MILSKNLNSEFGRVFGWTQGRPACGFLLGRFLPGENGYRIRHIDLNNPVVLFNDGNTAVAQFFYFFEQHGLIIKSFPVSQKQFFHTAPPLDQANFFVSFNLH